jgi:hypothetical protein|tara:strand:+ start:420 stop:596 length:177 start_codon:yes stop_codon:yes gene_type:complete
MKDEELKKFFMTVPDDEGRYTAIIQVSGFGSEEEAQVYLSKSQQISKEDIFKEGITIH